jgi:hypothetical protein
MKRSLSILCAASVLVAAQAFDVHAKPKHVLDFPSVIVGGKVELTGGGTVDARTGFQTTGGGFRVLQDISEGPLAGLKAGDGVRWEAAEFLPSTSFSVGSDPAKTVASDHDTYVMKVLFYTSDSHAAPLIANVFVSGKDKDPDQPGMQNVWIQGIGFGETRIAAR